MSKLKIFLLLSGYQLTWLMCVFGEVIYNSYVPGLISGSVFIFLSFLSSDYKKKFLFVVFLISVLGYIFDSVLVFFGIYNFNASFSFGFLPIWMLVLWPSFAILFDEVFVFLSKYKLIAIFLSGTLGPLTYYSGSPLDLINIYKLHLFLILMIIFWVCLMMFYLNYLIKFRFN